MRRSFYSLLAVVVGFGTLAAADPKPAGKAKVKLAVLVMFDQMHGDYPEKWKPIFGPDGFVRMQTDGATFTQCHYPYATTTTGPGHASVLSGTSPDRHGIVNNIWYEKGREVVCGTDPRYTLVPPPPKVDKPTEKTDDTKTEEKKEDPKAGGTPERLRAETVGDVLRAAYGENAKIFGLSLKERSAIFPTGQRATGAYWFTGRFVTSTYYTERLERPFPGWVTAFNDSNAARQWFGKDWTRFRPDLDYAKYSGTDNAAGEGSGTKQGKVFPHPITGGLKAVGNEYYTALANSPFGNELLLAFAKQCIANEELGKDDVPDLLTISFSSNDLIGHTWGPDSQEVLDVTLRSDAIVAELLGYLDEKVGKGNYTIAITADHGICPLPEFKRGDAKRVDPTPLRAGAEKHLKATFGDGPKPEGAKAAPGWIETMVARSWLYLNPRLVAASGKPREEVAKSLAEYLAKQPDILRTFTRADLASEMPANDEIGQKVKRSFVPDRCGDVYIVLKPYRLLARPVATGTNHGSPHDYDSHVPLIVYGPGIGGGAKPEPVTPQATTAILSQAMGIRPPAKADAPLPATLGAAK